MNDLQNKQFQLLKEFIKICNILNLDYYLVCGSALGAEKYGGFIPWDDDIDVAMKRNEYETFIKEANKYLDNRFFVQNYKTDINVPFMYTKIRDSSTTFIEKTSKFLNINHGIYIDLFPIDGYPKKNILLFEFFKNRYLFMNLSAFYYENPSYKFKLLFWFVKKIGYNTKTSITNAKLENLILKNDVNVSSLWCNFGNSRSKNEYVMKDVYGKGKPGYFEGIKVRLPEKIDEYLTQKYGDWRSDLPVEQQVSHHYTTVIDLDNPYTKYIHFDSGD